MHRQFQQARGDPSFGRPKKKKSSQKLDDDDRIRIILETQKEQLLAGTKSEILKHENKADLAENHLRGLKCQIEYQELDIGRSLERYTQSGREQDLLHEELADRERALRDTRIREIHEMEALKRTHEMHVAEFSKRKLIENQSIVNEFMIKVQEVQYETNCVNDSREFKDAESVRSGQLSHVPSESALIPLPTDPGGLLSRTRNPPA